MKALTHLVMLLPCFHLEIGICVEGNKSRYQDFQLQAVTFWEHTQIIQNMPQVHPGSRFRRNLPLRVQLEYSFPVVPSHANALA